MNEKPNKLHLVKQEDWMRHFIQCQLRELAQEELSNEDAEFSAAIIAMAATMPGVLDEALLEYGLSPASSIDHQTARAATPSLKNSSFVNNPLTEAVVKYGVAAASPEPIYRQVVTAIGKGRKFVEFEIADDKLELLQIGSSDATVKPCFQENYIFIVEREGAEPQTVTFYGGIYLSLEELKRMFLEYDDKARTIRLHHS